MASSRSTQNGPDWKDAIVALLAVGKATGGRVVVRLSPAGTEGRPVLHLTAEVLAEDEDHMVLRTLASASSRMTGSYDGDLATALLSLGYELDRDAYRRSEGLGPKTA